MFHKLEPGLLVGQKISYELTVQDTYVRRRTCTYVGVCIYSSTVFKCMIQLPYDVDEKCNLMDWLIASRGGSSTRQSRRDLCNQTSSMANPIGCPCFKFSLLK